jgi:hypothetical protein
VVPPSRSGSALACGRSQGGGGGATVARCGGPEEVGGRRGCASRARTCRWRRKTRAASGCRQLMEDAPPLARGCCRGGVVLRGAAPQAGQAELCGRGRPFPHSSSPAKPTKHQFIVRQKKAPFLLLPDTPRSKIKRRSSGLACRGGICHGISTASDLSTMEFVTPEHTTNRHTRVAAADEKDGIG